jgi:hypothetical protein
MLVAHRSFYATGLGGKLETVRRPDVVITNAGSQLNCRIAFKQPIDQKAKKMEGIVNASSEAMTQIINTVSSSIVALDSNKKSVISNGVCS